MLNKGLSTQKTQKVQTHHFKYANAVASDTVTLSEFDGAVGQLCHDFEQSVIVKRRQAAKAQAIYDEISDRFEEFFVSVTMRGASLGFFTRLKGQGYQMSISFDAINDRDLITVRWMILPELVFTTFHVDNAVDAIKAWLKDYDENEGTYEG